MSPRKVATASGDRSTQTGQYNAPVPESTGGTTSPSQSPLTLTVPMPPNIANGAHGHHMARHREKLAYWQTLDLLQGGGVIPRPPAVPFARATIRSTMYLGAAMDQSNSMRRHKWIEDWLVTRGYIADDRKKCLTWEGFPEQIVRRDGNYRIVLTLTPID